MLASQWVWQRTKSVSIPAEEQNAGRVVDYFYRMEFHITPRFFSDSNYLFFLLCPWMGKARSRGQICISFVFLIFPPLPLPLEYQKKVKVKIVGWPVGAAEIVFFFFRRKSQEVATESQKIL